MADQKSTVPIPAKRERLRGLVDRSLAPDVGMGTWQVLQSHNWKDLTGALHGMTRDQLTELETILEKNGQTNAAAVVRGNWSFYEGNKAVLGVAITNLLLGRPLTREMFNNAALLRASSDALKGMKPVKYDLNDIAGSPGIAVAERWRKGDTMFKYKKLNTPSGEKLYVDLKQTGYDPDLGVMCWTLHRTYITDPETGQKAVDDDGIEIGRAHV